MSKADKVSSASQTRNAKLTRARILAAAKIAFAKKGLAGARVDQIAAEANVNKRMIYHYFGSKEQLFTAVIETAYLDIRLAEEKLDINELPAIEALEKLVRFTWNYYLQNPEFITLVNSENLHRARHLREANPVIDANRKFVGRMQSLLARGVKEGAFRKGIDPVQINITIAAIGYYYFTNRFTGSIVFEREMMSDSALEERLLFNIETILRLVRRN